jgi:multidrug efflux pump subunit AcrB
VEALIAKTPDVASWSRLSGAMSGSGLELTEQNQGDILVRLKPDRDRASDDVMSDLRKDLEATHPGFEVDLIQILQDGIGDIAGSPAPIEVKIYGPDNATLVGLAHQTAAIITKIDGVVEVNDGVVESGPEAVVRVDARRAALAGLTTDAITSAATGSLWGTVATTVQQGEVGIGVRVKATPVAGGDPATVLPNIPIAAPGSALVPLRAVADIAIVPGTPQITRENQQQMVSVTARLEGRDLGSGVRDVQDQLQKALTLPSGYRMEMGGLYASQQESFAQLATVLLLAVLLVSTMLLILLRSFRQAFALLLAAILALGGVLAGLYVTGTPLNISSFTGAIMVVGIVTEDGIVFFDVVNHLRRFHPEYTVIQAVLEARRLRLRPILMTILAAILALLPLALGLGAGAAMQKPLAIAVIGGLIASTVFTLLVAPTFYVAVEGQGHRRGAGERG